MYHSIIVLLLFIVTQSGALCDWLCNHSDTGYLFIGCQYLCYSTVQQKEDMGHLDFKPNSQCFDNVEHFMSNSQCIDNVSHTILISQRNSCFEDLYLSRNLLNKCRMESEDINEQISDLLYEYTMLSESISEQNQTQFKQISDELYMCKLQQDSSITNVDKYRMEVWYLKLIVCCLLFSILL